MAQAPVRSVAPNLPVPPREYNAGYVDDLLRTLRLYFAKVDQRDPVVQASVTVTALNAAANVIGVDQAGLVVVDTTANNVAITLPAPSVAKGYMFMFKRVSAGANTLTITTPAGVIDSATSVSMPTQYDARTLRSDGTNYWVI